LLILQSRSEPDRISPLHVCDWGGTPTYYRQALYVRKAKPRRSCGALALLDLIASQPASQRDLRVGEGE
jgi:hypothetical protein